MRISACRICNNSNLVSLLHLGDQTLTGVFPKNKTEKITAGPLELVKCHPRNENDAVCHLVQLHHSYDSAEMYGLNYGYRSGLNASMVRHLQGIVKRVMELVKPEAGDLIIDIGSNDSTLLRSYPSDKGFILGGIDPTGVKFKDFYPKHVTLVPEFFSASAVTSNFKGKKAKIITSIAMFYDLEEPLGFVRQISESLEDNGVWIFEQSYLPAMLDTNSYDTICHEHLEYYGLRQVNWLLKKNGLRMINVEINDVNGGSFRVWAAKTNSSFSVSEDVEIIMKKEADMHLDTLEPYEKFTRNVFAHRDELRKLLTHLKSQGKKVLGYGASTKGNVMLQFCGFNSSDIPFIAEVNEDKFGSFTPATCIPIISEAEARAMNPDYFIVLPWHFRKGILEKESEFLNKGGKFIFPLPEIEIVGK